MADVVRGLGEKVAEVWMVVDAEPDMASLRRLATKPLHEALGTGLASQVYTIWHGLEMRSVPLVVHLVKQESHPAGLGNDEADGAAQAVDKEGEKGAPPHNANTAKGGGRREGPMGGGGGQGQKRDPRYVKNYG